MLINISQVQQRTTQSGLTYKACLANGNPVSVWPDYPMYNNVVEGAQVQGTIIQKGKYSNLIADQGQGGAPTQVYQPQTGYNPRPNRSNQITQAMEKKSAMINDVVTRKEQHIEQSQNRNERMWAKYNAAQIVAHHPSYQNLTSDQIEDTLKRLAMNIYMMDIEPFPSPSIPPIEPQYDPGPSPDQGGFYNPPVIDTPF